MRKPSQYYIDLINETAERERMKAKELRRQPIKRAVLCCFCGKSWDYDGVKAPEHIMEQAVDHEKRCDKNPYLAELEELRAADKTSKTNGRIVAKQRDELQDAVRDLVSALGRRNIAIATERLACLLPEFRGSH